MGFGKGQFEDVQDISWDSARASHAVLLCRMEQGEVKNYTETKKIDRIRRANAQRHPVPPSALANGKKQNQKTNKSMPCTNYNQGSCSYNRTHDTKGITYKHLCLACFVTGGKVYTHPENECRNKTRKKQVGWGMSVQQNMPVLRHALSGNTRIYYNKNSVKATLESQASKSLALKWFQD